MFFMPCEKKCNHYKFNPAAFFLASLLLAVFSFHAYAAVNTAGSASAYLGGTTAALNYTTSINANRVLIFSAAIASDAPATQITSITYGIQSFTKLSRVTSGPGTGTGVAAETWYLLNPNSGAGTVTVKQATAAQKSMGVTEFYGVSGLGNDASNSGNTNSLVISLLTTQARSVIAAFMAQRNSPQSMSFTAGAGSTNIWDRQGKVSNQYLRGLEFRRNTVSAGYNNVTCTSNRTNYACLAAVELKAALPSITGLAPAVIYTGGSQYVTITGTNFDNGCTVTIGGAAAAVSYLSPTSVSVFTPSGTAGPAQVVLTNLDGQTAASSIMYSNSPTPLISSCSPASGTTLGGQYITINGSNFSNPCSVYFANLTATAVYFISSSALGVTTPASGAGAVTVTVVNTDGQYAAKPAAYTFVKPPPEVLSCTPAFGLTTGGQAITVTGKYFVNGCTLTVGGTNALGLVFVDSATLRANTPLHAAGAVDVAVRNPDGQAGTLTAGYTYYLLGPPVLVSCSPASGSTAGGQAMTVSGSGFVSGCTVTIGGTAATGVTFINAATVAMTTPAHAAGTVDVKLTNPDGQASTLIGGYTFAVPPSIISCVPASGATAGGQSITVTGTNFRAGCTAVIGGISASLIRVNSSELILTTPAHAGGAVDIVVFNADFTQATLASGFTYDGTAPVITLNGGGANVAIACGSTYTEAATASDNIDGDITANIVRVIKDHLGIVTASVSTSVPEVYTITYDVSDAALNAAARVTRTVNVTDQTAPVISLNGGGADVTLQVGDTYTEGATAMDNIDGDITTKMAISTVDQLGSIVAGVSTTVPETFTVTYNVTDYSSNAAAEKQRIVRVVAKTLSYITVTQPPLKTTYKTGEAIDINGLLVTGTFTDLTSAVLSVSLSEVSGFDSSAAATGQIITVTVDSKSDTFTVNIKALSSIAITTPATKLVYDIGEPLSIAGMVVTGTYTDSSTETLPVTTANVSGFSSAAAQTGQVLTVTYGGRAAAYTVNIVPTLVSVAITTPASKLVYDIGETLSIAGMVVTGTYTDASQKTESITTGNVTGLDTTAAQAGQVLTVTVGGKTAVYTVDIVPTLASIAITTPASKLVFNVGDSLSITGMVVTGTYTDSNTKTEAITLSNVTGFNSTVPATGQVLTVTVGIRSTAYTVDIVQPQLVSIAITTPADKLDFVIGEPLDITGMVVTGTYDDLSLNIVPVTVSDVTGFDSSAVTASQTLTVNYDGKTTTYNVQILPLPPTVNLCTPDTGGNAGGTAVVIDGDNFVTGCTVTFGGAAATSVVFVDQFTLNMNTPPHVGGPVDVVVTNPNGQYGIGYGIFTYTGATATPSSTSTGTHTPTATPTASATGTAVLTGTFTPTVTRTSTTGPSSTDTPDYTHTVTPTITRTSTNTPDYSATNTPSITRTSTITPNYTATNTRTITRTSTDTPVYSPTNTPTITGTYTVTRTFTGTFTQTSTRTVTPTRTATGTYTASSTVTSTRTLTSTATVTATGGYTPAAAGSSYVFPQPADNTLNIIYQAETAGQVRIYVYNAAGMPVADFTDNALAGFTNKAVLDISGFASGVYFYVIRAKDASGKDVNYKPGKFLVSK